MEGSVDDVPLLWCFRQTNQNMPPAQLDWLQTLFGVVLSDMQVFDTLLGRNIGMGVRLYWTMCCATKLHRRQSHRLLTHFFATPWLVLCRRQRRADESSRSRWSARALRVISLTDDVCAHRLNSAAVEIKLT